MKREILINCAISAALQGNWLKAKKFNLALLKKTPSNLDALLRLAKAYKELGETDLAKKIYRQAIKIDRFNPIAKRELLKLKQLKTKRKKQKKSSPSFFTNDFFLEEPGKTKAIPLIKLNSEKVILSLNPAQEVQLVIGKNSISVRDKQNCYLGRLPDDLSRRLIKLIKRGNKYLAVVKDVNKKKLVIFIKETKRSKKNANFPSFLNTSNQHLSFPFQNHIKENH